MILEPARFPAFIDYFVIEDGDMVICVWFER